MLLLYIIKICKSRMPNQKYKRKRKHALHNKLKTTHRMRRNSTYKTFPKHKTRSAVYGKILPPIDVRTPSDIQGLIKRIMEGPLVIALVYLKSCHYCHIIEPKFDNASNNPKRSVQSAKINESMVSQVNSALKKFNPTNNKPINVNAYPTILSLNTKGESQPEIKVTEQEDITEVMNTTSNPNLQSDINTPNNTPLSNSFTTPLPTTSRPQITTSPSPSSMEPRTDKEPPIVDPSASAFDIDTPHNIVPRRTGGSLFNTFAKTAYTLAPTAALLATAALIIKPRTKRHTTQHTKRRHTRKT
jgi:thiol-disulfide isomerase/thioredoxin